jgi:FlaA1/EpsC-like NDP-sugar epimerase
MENSPKEAIKNNVFGTYKVATTADKYGAKKFVLISTDKAVNPTNVMGATKRMAEMVIMSLNTRSKTDFVAVRFGNVLGSNGSVIPLFKRQIQNGGPVTVTDPNIIRYFMTIPEAAKLVIQTGAMAKGGEIFILDMGEPVKILALAEDLIKLSGLVPYRDIDITFTGLRPGEKLYEELMQREEGTTESSKEGIFVAKPSNMTYDEMKEFLDTLSKTIDRNDNIVECIKRIVPTYKPGQTG